jgi:hypothetical protein
MGFSRKIISVLAALALVGSLVSCSPRPTNYDAPHPTERPAITATYTPSPSPTATATYTPSPTATMTATPTNTPYPTATMTATPTNTPSPTPTMTPTYTPTPTNTPTLTCVKFFYDGNMSGSKDENEPFLSPDVKSYKQSQDGCYYVPEGKTTLYIAGKAPNGKNLLNATLDWPKGVNLLPQITVDTTKTREIGLVDGFCSSPIRPENLFREEYKKFEENPALWFEIYQKYYTESNVSPNWLFYGYNINWNDPRKGLKEHLAFDIWGKDETPVYASVPGVVADVFQNAINIRYTQGSIVNLGHIKPILQIGRKVEAGQLVGYIIGSEGNHVHMELVPDGSQILYCFPGLGPNDLLINPTQGPHPVLPYFGR